MELYDYARSSAAYRVRIALNLKGIAYQACPIDLRTAQHLADDYRARNPQALVPTLVDDALTIGQSLAILDYLEERYPEPALLPAEPVARALARRIALMIACEIHPLNNMRVLRYLEHQLGCDEAVRQAWYEHWIAEGLEPIEALLAGQAGPFCLGEQVTIADVCLVPQLYNARRYACDLATYPRLRAIDEHCQALPAFAEAAPERQASA